VEPPPSANPVRRPGGCFLDFVRAFAATFVLQMLVVRLVAGSYEVAAAQALLAFAAFRVLKPRLWWSLGVLTLYRAFYLLVEVSCMRPEAPGHWEACQKSGYEVLITEAVWCIFLALLLIRHFLGEGSQQHKRIRAAVGYLIPHLEERPVPDATDQVLLRPATALPADSLLRASSSRGASDRSLLLHLEGEIVSAKPAVVPHSVAVARPISTSAPSQAAFDHIRRLVQIGCLACLLLAAWRGVRYYSVDRHRADLTRAARYGLTQVIERRIREGADPNTTTAYGRTLLSLAAQSGSVDTVKALLDARADVHRADSSGRSPLIYAAIEANPDVTRLLLQHGAAVNAADQFGDSPLIYAVRPGGIGVVLALLAHGADINHRNNIGADAHMCSGTLKDPEILLTLLKRGADPRRVAEDRSSALLQASKSCPSVVPALLARGADPNVSDPMLKTPLMFAIEAKDARAVKALLLAGADVNAKNFSGSTPLELARSEQWDWAVKQILIVQADSKRKIRKPVAAKS
jgi:ankyrin repeat protein